MLKPKRRFYLQLLILLASKFITELLKVCIDLNIWCCALYADKKGKKDTACQTLIEFTRQGHSPIGPMQIVISYGMLNRLQSVLENKFRLPKLVADLYINLIEKYAEIGALREGPQLILGGGVIALKDNEDSHVLETAIAGQALILITENFKDFISKDTHIMIENRHAVSFTANHSFHIAHPFKALEWMRNNKIPDIASFSNLRVDPGNNLVCVDYSKNGQNKLTSPENIQEIKTNTLYKH